VRRAVIQGPRDAVLAEAPLPHRPPGAYLVAVRACALCTWEQRVHRGATPQYPFAGGHEIGGAIVAGPDGGLPAGTLVAVSRLPRCGRCVACTSGLDNLCAYLTPSGGGDGPGGLAEYLVADERDVAPLPDARTPAEAALVEPLACVLNSLAVARVERGSRLAVVGNGFMGVLHARAAAARGAEAVLHDTGPAPAGLEHAWSGPRRALEPEREALSRRTPSPDDGPFDAAIVIRGAPRSVTAAAHLVRPGGVVSVYSSLGRDEDIGLPSQLMRRKQVVLTAAASHRRSDFAAAVRQVGDGTVAVADLVHRSYPLARVQEALEYAGATDSGRVIVTLDGELNPSES
jgi:threonine dehydrogenase-like Zn-dependent dehydrogenase